MAELSSREELLAAVRGRTGWIISDGKAGNETQCRGVFDALGLVSEVKPIQPGWLQQKLSPYVGVARTERFGQPDSTFCPPWPDFAISAGRLAAPYIRAIKRHARLRTYTIILQDPKVPLSSADLFWMPEHDRRRGPNVVTTVVSPHGFSPERLAKLREAPPPSTFDKVPRPWTAVLIGGDGSSYTYTPEDMTRLARALRRLAELGAGLLMTPSRRTPRALLAAINEATRDFPRFLWDGYGYNPLPAMLAHADRFVVTADSINMCGEPAVTGRPIEVFTPSGGSDKFNRYQAALAKHGATRPLDDVPTKLANWTYEPLYSASDIAAAIAERWVRRRTMLSGLVGS
jgi:mitochondrial fission protein ELM1